MADINKIKLPDSSEYNIIDYRIPGVDTVPTSGSDNVVTSGGVYDKINDESLVISAALNDLNDRLSEIEETDPIFSVSPAANITSSDITNWNSKTSNIGTVTQINIGSTSYDPSNGVVSLPAYPTVTDTKNTAGSTDTSNKIFLIGATSQAANPQTYSDDEVYATSGVLTTKSVQVGGTAATIQYNSTDQSIEFIFA